MINYDIDVEGLGLVGEFHQDTNLEIERLTILRLDNSVLP